MARSFSNAKLCSAFVVDRVSLVLSRRGYAAAAAPQGAVSGSAGAGRMGKKGADESTKTSWVPDPVTGYYRPENRADEIDVAALRDLLLKNNVKRQ